MDFGRLSKKLQNCPYPKEMLHVDRGLSGWGFYPAARGHDSTGSPLNGIMLLGRDWGALGEYDVFRSSAEQTETGTTSRRTRTLVMPRLEEFGVFRTNYLPGLRRERPSNGNLKNRIEPDAWSKYEEFAWRFLQEQVCLQKPRLVIVLGIPNEEDLVKRLQSIKWNRDEFFPQDFTNGELPHGTYITFLDHPFSISNPIVRRRFDEKLDRILTFMQS